MELTFTKVQDAGIRAAREAHNAALPEVYEDVDGEQVAVSPKPGTLATNDEYVQMIMSQAADSYAKQFGLIVAELDAKIVELQAKRVKAVEATK